MIAQHVFCQIEREPIGVVELECDFAGQRMSTTFLDAREFGVD